MPELNPTATEPIRRAALSAADRLAPEHGPGLCTDVLALLYTAEKDRRTDQYLDPISIASLIVSAATFAWTIYQDLRDKTSKPDHEIVARRVRVALSDNNQEITPEQRDHVI